MKGDKLIATFTFIAMLTGCTGIPRESSISDRHPRIFPDYTDIDIPCNIAPLNFLIEEDADRIMTEYKAGNVSFKRKGKTPSLGRRAWKKLQKESCIQVFVHLKNKGKWTSCAPFTMTVTDPIDRYVSYRLIPPAFRQYEEMSLMQRDLTTFRERAIYRNTLIQRPAKGLGQCVNCHHFQNYNTDNMQFHVRQYKSGTVLVNNGKPKIVNIKTSYPAWHPTLPLIAYSTNNTMQAFHTSNHNRIEVFDIESGLVLYDIDTDCTTTVQDSVNQLECFPAWSPDGTFLYFVSARIDPSNLDETTVTDLYETLHYNLYRRSFNTDTRQFGETELIYDAAAEGSSVTLPRISPDGKLLMLAISPYGVFHIWHKDADLLLIDLRNGNLRTLEELNSTYAESYHSWSHDSKWTIFCSRRQDGAFSRLYIAHLNDDGRFSKPFPIPQRAPQSDLTRLFSYNVPEFTLQPVRISPQRFARLIRKTKDTGIRKR